MAHQTHTDYDSHQAYADLTGGSCQCADCQKAYAAAEDEFCAECGAHTGEHYLICSQREG